MHSPIWAQNNSEKAPFLIGEVEIPGQQAGRLNYLLSLSQQDFNNQIYVFYTDSNATVAYININGRKLRLTGGTNPEHIMAYAGYDYTVTINNARKDMNSTNSKDKWGISGTLVIYNKMGQAVVEDVQGTQTR